MLGYDFQCQSGNCNGKWFSLDGTTDITNIANKFNALLGKGWTPIKNNEVLMLS